MKKVIGIAVFALAIAGCSGSSNGTSTSTGASGSNSSGGSGTSLGQTSSGNTNGSSNGQTTSGNTNGQTTSGNTNGQTTAGGSSLSGTLAFGVGKTMGVFVGLPDGGVDPTYLEVDFSDDSTDTCLLQEQGFPDGGFPAAISHFGSLYIQDPSNLKLNSPYQSVTAEQLAIHAADGGGVPTGGFMQVIVETPTDAFTSVGGTATITSVSNSGITATLNSVSMAYPDGGNSSTLSGTLDVTDTQNCVFQAQPQ